MATKKKIIEASKKTDEALSKLQSDHIKAVQKSMELLNKKLIDASKMLETDSNGLLVNDKVAFLQAQKLHTKIESLYATEFTDTMKEQISKLGEVKQVIRTNFSDLGSSTKFTDIDNKMMDALQDSYYADFVSLSDTNKNKVVQAMYNQVIAGSPYSELIDTITNAVSGLQSQTGRSLSQYATLYARDMVMNFHNSVTLKKAEDGEFDTFLYMGTVMKRSRAFCIERVGKAYTKQQIDSWTFGWAGKSGPAMTHRGGYNCRHHWQPVKSSWLTEEQKAELEEEIREPLKQEVKEPEKYFRRPTIQQVEGHMNAVYNSDQYKSLSANHENTKQNHVNTKREFEQAGQLLKDHIAKNKISAKELLNPQDPLTKKLMDNVSLLGDKVSTTRFIRNNSERALREYETKQFNSLIFPNETKKLDFTLPNNQLSSNKSTASKQRQAFDDMADKVSKMFHTNVTNSIPAYQIEYKAGSRAYCDFSKNIISLGSVNEPGVLAHEYAHAVEINYPGAKQAAFDFRTARIGNEEKSVIFKGKDGKPDEMGWKDEFFNHYCGKDYGNWCTEILSMGIERVYTDPKAFFQEDPEYFDLCLKVMWGDL